jgi:5-methylcytosine-specific restriction endonuclease McrA
MGKRYTDEDCYENLLKVWTHYGRAPQHDEMNHPPSTVGSKAYIGRFGTWNGALQAFADRANADVAQSENPRPAEIQVEVVKTRSTVSPADRREVPLGLRWAVIVRDRCRCVLCGRSPATHVGVSLHVDHVVPFSKGGKTIIENLRTLCDDCNLGKGSKLEEIMTQDTEQRQGEAS